MSHQIKVACGASVWFVVFGMMALGQANSLDQMQREAMQMEKERDCEGAYKKYEEIKQQNAARPGSRKKDLLTAFLATRMNALEKCYQGCIPTEEEKKFLDQAKQYAENKQAKRAHRILARLLRGKNPRCKSWREGHELMRAIVAADKTPRRRHQQSVDPCDLEDQTKQDLTSLGTNIQQLEKKIADLQKPYVLPPPPDPPRWAKTGARYKRWLRSWKWRMRQKMRRDRVRLEYQRLNELQKAFKDIRVLRDQVWKYREEFQSCDQVYTALRERTQSLKQSEDNAYAGIVGLYKGRAERMRQNMLYYSRRYNQIRKEQKTDQQTIESLKATMQRQQELVDNVTQDLVLLSNMLVFKPDNPAEGTLLQNSMGHFQDLMDNQQKLFAAIQKRYPHYLQSQEGRKELQNQLATLERFEKVLERFLDGQTGDKAEKLQKTLQGVRASIQLLEKADKELANKPLPAKGASSPAASASVLRSTDSASHPSNRNSWGWLFLVIGLGLIGGASFYLWRERQKRALESSEA